MVEVGEDVMVEVVMVEVVEDVMVWRTKEEVGR